MTTQTTQTSLPAALILAGGAGTRLWPLSTDDLPKQFLTIFDGASLLQKTFARLNHLTAPERIFISTNDRYASLVAAQLPSLPPENIIVEPARRNTAPALALCTSEIARRLGDDTVVAIFPSDHAVADEPAFLGAIRIAVDAARNHDAIVTVAIQPTRPDTGFGYLELGVEVAPSLHRLQRFIEKPPLARAEELVASGTHAWNGGMFIYRAGYFLRLLRQLAPDIASGTELYFAADSTRRAAAYEAMPSISIDFAVMEKAPDVLAVRADFGWSDVGSWRAVAEIAGRSGLLHTLRAQNAFSLTTSSRPVAIVGFDDVAVVESERGILVLNLNDDEGLSRFVQELERGRSS